MDKLISKKKPFYSLSEGLVAYLKEYNRWVDTPISYEDLLRFSGSIAVYNNSDEDTLWVRVFYAEHERKDIDYDLKKIYTLLHSDGNESALPYLAVDAIDYCTFGNSKPFRIKIRNIINDNFSYFYVKKTDASRVCGLEFEHMLSPYNLNFLVNSNSLIEEHIAGIPGDDFIKHSLGECTPTQQAQIAKEYVKFNERSMIRLLGDMRAYNYVIIPIHDFDQVIYKIRAIDFDQQCYEGKLSVYRPQFFKENFPIMELVRKRLKHDAIVQYKIEERSIVAKRLISYEGRISQLIKEMRCLTLSTQENLDKLKMEIFQFTRDPKFKACTSMGDVMDAAFDFVRNNYQNLSLNKFF